MTTTAFGRFLEFSIPTADIRASLDFYLRLGFSELSVGDIHDYYYAVVTDGRIAIGLHAAGIDESALSFVNTDVGAIAHSISTQQDAEIVFSRLGAEDFHEIGIYAPDAHLLVILEARTFSQADFSRQPEPLIGRCTEISLGCRDLLSATAFWSKAGFIANDDAATDSIELLAPGLRLCLRANLRPGTKTLRYAPDDYGEMLERLGAAGIPQRGAGHNCQITAPEGTRLDIINHSA